MKKKKSKLSCFPRGSLLVVSALKLKLLSSFLLLVLMFATFNSFAIDGEQQQQREVTGNVTDWEGLPLPGVTVLVKGTSIGTVTNMDGDFSLRVPANAETLVFSFVGMRTQELALAGRTSFSVTMEEETIGLEEVVAVGYGVQRKESVVGSISQTSNEELRRSGNSTDLTESLVGQIPGMVALTSSGEPGGILTGESAT
ncbi:MAG: carboxypeptidase-like regulatory domain-containing protein, partial [Bacteroidales bacterium]|nr:carboxypeptidase-like regulatory domain-containing protein [Bacteroidales bacterium]